MKRTDIKVTKEQYDEIENSHRISVQNGDPSRKTFFEQADKANTWVRNFILMLVSLAGGITGLWTVATRPITAQLQANKEQQAKDVARLEAIIHSHMTVSATDRWTARMEIFSHKLVDLFGRSLTPEEVKDIQTALYPGAPSPEAFLHSMETKAAQENAGDPS